MIDAKGLKGLTHISNVGISFFRGLIKAMKNFVPPHYQ